MKLSKTKIILLIILGILLIRETGFINLNYFSSTARTYTGKSSLSESILSEENLDIFIDWKDEKLINTNKSDGVLAKEVSREGLGLNIYVPFKKSAMTKFKFKVFKKTKFIGTLEINHHVTVNGLATAKNFTSVVKKSVSRRIVKHLQGKSFAIDSRKKQDTKWLDCRKPNYFTTSTWDGNQKGKIQRSICSEEILETRTDTFYFNNHKIATINSKKEHDKYIFETLTYRPEDTIILEVKRYFGSGQLGFEGSFYELDYKKLNMKLPEYKDNMQPIGVWNQWDAAGKLVKTRDFAKEPHKNNWF